MMATASENPKVEGVMVNTCPEPENAISKASKEPVAAQSSTKPTVIRLKRRIEDPPSKILVVSYKRSKTEFTGVPTNSVQVQVKDDDSSDPVCSKVLRLVGTVPEEEADGNNVALTIKNILGSDKPAATASCSGSDLTNLFTRVNIKTKKSSIAEKTRERVKKNTAEKRFKIISSRRGMPNDEEPEKYDMDLLKLLDLVPESKSKESQKKVKPEGFEPGNVTCNGKPMVKEVSANEDGFVYDLYMANDPCIEEFMGGQFLSVEEGDDQLDFGEYRNGSEHVDDYVEEDDDSNDEGNWRNDYPDSDEEGLRDESYGAEGHNSDDGINFKSINLKGDSSSDDDVVYGIDDDNDGVMGFDKKYALYKHRVMREYEDEVVSVPSDCDDD